MPKAVVDKVLAQPRHQAQGFHVGPERMVVLRREEGCLLYTSRCV